MHPRSILCPESYCPAVYISSNGGAAEHQVSHIFGLVTQWASDYRHPHQALMYSLQADSIGCFDYEGSVMGDQYPNYVNPQGKFLTVTGHR